MKRWIFLFCLAAGTLSGQYCTSGLYSFGCTSGDDINDFSLGSFSHSNTGCSGTGGYNDYTSMTITVIQTLPQALNVTTNYTSSEYLKLFIDYNSDQDFDDPGETVYTSASFGSGTPLTDNITFAAGTPTGSFRMRARLVWLGSTFTACSSESFGEIHDYTIVIQDNDCPAPKAFKVDEEGCDNADVSWDSNTGSSFLVYGPDGFDPEVSGTYTSIISSPYNITGLSPGTAYDVYVADTCDNDSSFLQGPEDIQTIAGTTADFVATPGVPAFNRRTVYFDASMSGAANTYEWDFGNGETATGEFTSHIYKVNGTYQVRLIASNNCETDTMIKTVVVEEINVEQYQLAQSLKIFPNPAKDLVNISFSGAHSSATLRLLDLSGRQLLEKVVATSGGKYQGSIQLREFPVGVYLLQLNDGNNQVQRRLLVQ